MPRASPGPGADRTILGDKVMPDPFRRTFDHRQHRVCQRFAHARAMSRKPHVGKRGLPLKRMRDRQLSAGAGTLRSVSFGAIPTGELTYLTQRIDVSSRRLVRTRCRGIGAWMLIAAEK